MLRPAISPIDWPDFSPTDGKLDVLCKLSEFYGRDPSMVLAGGGNTSCKMGDRLFVKASGSSLATITVDGFVEMDRSKLDELVQSDLDEDPETREAQFQSAISAARCEPEKGQRPSVEVLLHHVVPGAYAVHSHSTLVNTLTCHADGKELSAELFGDEVIWLPYVDPGYTLAQQLRTCLADYTSKTGKAEPKGILMANHGLIVAGDDPETIRAHTDEILTKIEARLGEQWHTDSFGAVTAQQNSADLVRIMGPALRGLLAEGNGETLKIVAFDDSPLALSLVGSAAGRQAACAGPMTPDQIVYCNSYPLWFQAKDEDAETALVERLRAAVDEHTKRTHFAPKIVLVEGVGLFAAGDDWAQADTSRLVYLDAVKVMAGATRLGGVNFLADRDRQFIEHWEVEAYRKKVAAASSKSTGRLNRKVAVITGAAQGFGREIAKGLAAEGALVVLTDLNEDGARDATDELSAQHGPGRAVGLPIDVTDSDSIRECLNRVVRIYGGLDIFVSNAGVLKAESVKTQPESDFDFVTAVNYKGYFLGVQQAAPILATQHRANPAYRSDIVQINSKSGLVGSKRNFAYAGSKFGGIGLTQSFALELIDDGVKVNSICPGNYFDGPLWSDPDHGLFAQYLRAGKVPGAKSVDDVRRFYEAKVPMGRGCQPEDVVTAILYVIQQRYETGQAIPVTGGQDMLR